MITLQLYSSNTSLVSTAAKLQTAYNQGTCQVTLDTDNCAAYCLESAYMGHDIPEQLVPMCNEILSLFDEVYQ